MNKKSPWKIILSTDVSPSPWFPIKKDLIELPNGTQTEYFTSQLKDVAMIVPITHDNQVVFVRQYKHGIGEFPLEFPAGRVEDGQTVTKAAVDELVQETGIKVEEANLQYVTELWTEPSKSSVRVHCYLVRDIEITHEQDLEETENIEVVLIPVDELSTRITQGEIHASDTLALICVLREKGLL